MIEFMWDELIEGETYIINRSLSEDFMEAIEVLFIQYMYMEATGRFKDLGGVRKWDISYKDRGNKIFILGRLDTYRIYRHSNPSVSAEVLTGKLWKDAVDDLHGKFELPDGWKASMEAASIMGKKFGDWTKDYRTGEDR